jgi:hypothetical protein
MSFSRLSGFSGISNARIVKYTFLQNSEDFSSALCQVHAAPGGDDEARQQQRELAILR